MNKLILSAALLLAAAAAAWWTSDQWLPQAGPWTEQAWKKITRPGPESLPPDKRPAAAQARPVQAGASQPVAPQPRKCVRDGRTTYGRRTFLFADEPAQRDGADLNLLAARSPSLRLPRSPWPAACNSPCPANCARRCPSPWPYTSLPH